MGRAKAHHLILTSTECAYLEDRADIDDEGRVSSRKAERQALLEVVAKSHEKDGGQKLIVAMDSQLQQGANRDPVGSS